MTLHWQSAALFQKNTTTAFICILQVSDNMDDQPTPNLHLPFQGPGTYIHYLSNRLKVGAVLLISQLYMLERSGYDSCQGHFILPEG